MSRNNDKGGRRQYRNVGCRKKEYICNSTNLGSSSPVIKQSSSCNDSGNSCYVENKIPAVAEVNGNVDCNERNSRFAGKDHKVTFGEISPSNRNKQPSNVLHNPAGYTVDRKLRGIDVHERVQKLLHYHDSFGDGDEMCYRIVGSNRAGHCDRNVTYSGKGNNEPLEKEGISLARNSKSASSSHNLACCHGEKELRNFDTVSEESTHDRPKILTSVNRDDGVYTDRSSVQSAGFFSDNRDPFVVISTCMSEITRLTNSVLSNHNKEIEKISSQITEASKNEVISSILKNRKANMVSQQTCFDGFLQEMRTETSGLYGKSDSTFIRKRTEEILSKVKAECILFSKMIPAYSLKQVLKTTLTSNQVILLSCDVDYCSNIVVPLLVQNMPRSRLIASCEVNEAAALISAQNCSSTVEQKVGQLVGYDIGRESMKSHLSTKILYTTVPGLFSYSLEDPLFTRYSCIILNEILQRSIEADILLASLRKCLAKRNDLKLIVIVATEHTAKNLESYFSRNDISRINTEKLSLPVQVIWKKAFCNSDDDVITEAVNICFGICILKFNEKGNVLVFLPTEEDALKAAELTVKILHDYNVHDVLCNHISEKNKKKLLRVSEQPTKRTIFFVNSGFEFVMFPNIRYVVDSGRTSEICYDAEKKLELQKTSFISRLRSKIRKKCAGTYASGICYRMYSTENYKKCMVSNELPEVLNRSPLNSLVKIIQYGNCDALSTEFIEPFPEQVKENAMKALQSLGALKEGKLTHLGERIIKMPFLPEYSKLIVLGKERGFPFEVIVLVSFFLVKGYVFKYENTEEFKKQTDLAKLHFIQNDSDTLTFLNIYRQWAENEYSKLWCTNNYIEFSFLDSVRSKIQEVLEIVSRNLGEIVLDKFSGDYQTNSDMWPSLQEIIFECFRNNICVYTGHCLSGYRCLTAKCIVFVHPSTCFTRKENLPQFIVYDKFISKTRDIITCITAIPDACVAKAFDHEILFEQKLVPVVIDPVGLTIIKRVLTKEKLRDLEEQIKKETKSEMIVIEPSEEKGNVTIYALSSCRKKVEEIMRKFLNENIQNFWDEEETLVVELQKGSTTVPVTVTWSKGAEISSVVTGSHENTNINSQAGASCNNSTSNTETTTRHGCILLTWIRRPCVGDGFVEFETRKDFSEARKLSMQILEVKGCSAEVEVDEDGENRLHIRNLGPEITDEDLKNAVQEKLANVSISNVKVVRRHSFETTSDDIAIIEESLREQLREIFGRPVVDVIKIHKPKNAAEITMTAEFQPFMGWNVYSLEQLAAFLNGLLQVNDVCIQTRVSYYSHLFCSLDIWNKLRPRVFSAHKTFEQELENSNLCCVIEEEAFDSQTVRIKISSENETGMTNFQNIVQDLLKGCIIASASIPKLFCHGGYLWLRALEKSANVYIIDDYNSKTICLYGSEEACKAAGLSIEQFLNSTEMETVLTTSLAVGKNSRALLRAIIQKYDVELREFINDCELRAAELDIRKCELTLHGSADSIEKAINLLEDLEKQCDSDCVKMMQSDQETCPACLCPALTMTFRLEKCGHLYCGNCIKVLVANVEVPGADIEIPLVCGAEDCGKELILEDIRRLFDHDTEKVKALLKKSLKNYISRRGNYIYCPVPDCAMFLDKESFHGEKWNCPLCHNDICVECRVIYHHGFSCDMYQGMQTNVDYGFEVWKRNNTDCKQCPYKCGAEIQKNDGCNHMTCIKCKGHFCWRCLGTFSDGWAVSRHQSSCPAPPQ